ncbi:hypothetical protein [Roseicella aquatilis]|uniref:Uncharacterized protein n=1 Tax=Roseicella aquatilis TaxID=2527868 RepID=A0A4R4DRX3_9PROT|nr:hypothetical protein [Roseicella aquatilis]TCZ63217.1 hypothetical protein EXY23_10305 [Roseicella aquatilis]
MTHAMLPALALLPTLPAEAALVLVLAACLALMALLGPEESPAPVDEEITAAAILALHGHV